MFARPCTSQAGQSLLHKDGKGLSSIFLNLLLSAALSVPHVHIHAPHPEERDAPVSEDVTAGIQHRKTKKTRCSAPLLQKEQSGRGSLDAEGKEEGKTPCFEATRFTPGGGGGRTFAC